jgi:uncharacterized protein (UPF0335 family)
VPRAREGTGRHDLAVPIGFIATPRRFTLHLPPCTYIHGIALIEEESMTNSVGIAGDRIRSFIERVEHIEEELKELAEGKKEIFAEAKGEGFDVKVLKEILKLRKQDQSERDEQESLLDLYLSAMQTSDEGQAKAA